MPELHTKLTQPWGDPDSDHEILRRKTIATCDAFVGDKVTLRNLFSIIGGRLGVAELSIVSPDPGTRLIGGFLDDTVFIGFGCWRRDQLPYGFDAEQTRNAEVTWKELNCGTADAWKAMFGAVPIHVPIPLLKKQKKGEG